VALPSDLLTLLRHQNGGYVADEFAACPTSRPTSWADDHVAVQEIAGIGGNRVLSLLDTPSLNAEWQQPPELVLLSGDGHWWIALDYRQCGPQGEPPVVFYENDSEASPDDLRLAPSFREFVCLLRPEPDVDGSHDPSR
jgi:SMI1/KNR4 family protein SUKH-1